jgi:hypothetical protein
MLFVALASAAELQRRRAIAACASAAPWQPRVAVMASSPRASSLLRFLLVRLSLTVDELFELRDGLDAHLRERVGIAEGPPKRRTLYLPTDSMRDL